VKQTESKRFLLAAQLSEHKLLQTWFVTFADLPSCAGAASAAVSPGQTSVLSGFLGCRSAEMMPDVEEQRCELQSSGLTVRAVMGLTTWCTQCTMLDHIS
jgi:hypothetical protein